MFESELPDVQPAGMRGYVSMDFFRMLAIRYYMYTAQWSKAETLCRYLMNSGNYSRVRQGNDVYSAYEMAVNTCPNSETIFSCPADKSHGNIWVTEVTFSGAAALGPGQNVTTSGWGERPRSSRSK